MTKKHYPPTQGRRRILRFFFSFLDCQNGGSFPSLPRLPPH